MWENECKSEKKVCNGSSGNGGSNKFDKSQSNTNKYAMFGIIYHPTKMRLSPDWPDMTSWL